MGTPITTLAPASPSPPGAGLLRRTDVVACNLADARGGLLSLARPECQMALEADGLDPVVKTSGSKGMQVYAPIRVSDREHPSRYAKHLAQELSAETPHQVVWLKPRIMNGYPLAS